MLATALFSSEKQIIVGSFIQENYASNSVRRLNSFIENDEKLAALIKKNDIEVKLKVIGEYNTVSLSPFNSYVQLLRTLRELAKYYDDAYVLDNAKKEKLTLAMVEEIVKKEIEPAEVVTPKVQEPKVVQKVQKPKAKSDSSVGVKTHKKVPPSVINQPMEEEVDYTLEIALVLLLLVGMVYILYKRKAKRKKEEAE